VTADERLHVLDTTILGNFANVLRPDLIQLALRQLGATTTIVRDELHLGEVQGLIPRCDWSLLGLIELSPQEEVLFEQLGRTLGRGEASCLAIARSRNAVAVTDDFPARQMARRLDIPVPAH
jgi:predicted nucleic acid-binding protein